MEGKAFAFLAFVAAGPCIVIITRGLRIKGDAIICTLLFVPFFLSCGIFFKQIELQRRGRNDVRLDAQVLSTTDQLYEATKNNHSHYNKVRQALTCDLMMIFVSFVYSKLARWHIASRLSLQNVMISNVYYIHLSLISISCCYLAKIKFFWIENSFTRTGV